MTKDDLKLGQKVKLTMYNGGEKKVGLSAYNTLFNMCSKDEPLHIPGSELKISLHAVLYNKATYGVEIEGTLV
jgi:hypothetical protein